MAMSVSGYNVEAVRRRFTMLRDNAFTFLDAPGGSQVPDEVANAYADNAKYSSANFGGFYPTSYRVTEVNKVAREKAAEFLGGDASQIVFGGSMTSVNFALTRAAARSFQPGDEIITTALDHDGNVAPWRELAKDLGLVMKVARVDENLFLDVEHLKSLITDRTKVIAFPWSANSIGHMTPAKEICDIAHEAGAIAWVDAVQYAAHRKVDARAIGADVITCSAYKFAGPHLGIAHVEDRVAKDWDGYKVMPRDNYPLGSRFETGTQPYELLAGLIKTFDYLKSIGGFEKIEQHEEQLGQMMMDRLPAGIEVLGTKDVTKRVPTFLLDIPGVEAETVARRLGEQNIAVWHHDHWYAMSLGEYLPKRDTLRVGFAHYNNEMDVDRFITAISEFAK
ncbi:aminotransferase class V-fold PLP-dependent enzyme [Leucobacter sp. USHLN153]|uniref:aminotransferase class V-fold PLP-dependent enzyme n=1 Tax=Leucobacter sp. USHLN153 TaxID=3081268 RepID=UPI0030163731